MPALPPVPPARHRLLALSLMMVAGSVDAVCYLSLAHIYTANMSGNSVSLGSQLAVWNLRDVCVRALPIVAFFIGLLIASTIHEWCHRRQIRQMFAIIFGIEALFLAAYLFAGAFLNPGKPPNPPLATFITLGSFAAIAMGVQNASLRKVGALTVHTTHITGLLLQLADAVVEVVVAIVGGRRVGGGRGKKIHNAAFLFSLWVLYVAGAVVGALGLPHFGAGTLLPTLVLLVFWAFADWHQPLARPGDV